MCDKIFKDQLKVMSNEELLVKTKDHAVDVYIIGRDYPSIQLCTNDLQCFDSSRMCMFTKIGITISLEYIDYLKII